ncbi:hypothetical protein BCV70DRAFT_32607 [Testicularia cyperi]|uniref:Uncharacterized protein n=1 Tax=Testicularia cyperi TaxID=1882483 RepID=A0A317XKA2_9BASI|nr:hypothetical protein BCV70DRAFT_32607 [Testicularia cyperi]
MGRTLYMQTGRANKGKAAAAFRTPLILSVPAVSRQTGSYTRCLSGPSAAPLLVPHAFYLLPTPLKYRTAEYSTVVNAISLRLTPLLGLVWFFFFLRGCRSRNSSRAWDHPRQSFLFLG